MTAIPVAGPEFANVPDLKLLAVNESPAITPMRIGVPEIAATVEESKFRFTTDRPEIVIVFTVMFAAPSAGCANR